MTEKLLVVNVPLLTVNVPVTVKASCKVLVAVPAAAAPKITLLLNVFPPLVTVKDPEAAGKDVTPEKLQVIPATSVQLPLMASVFDPVMVPVNPVHVRFRQLAAAVIVTVTVPEAAVKNTLSTLVGTVCPPAPPDVAAHLVPAVASQFAVPPTQ